MYLHELGLWYSPPFSLMLHGFSDVDFADRRLDRKEWEYLSVFGFLVGFLFVSQIV
jgi:hypothetical protein